MKKIFSLFLACSIFLAAPVFADSNDRSTYISTATTTVVKNNSGYLKKVTVTETAAGAITIYNNSAASGEVIAVLKASIAEQTFDFGNRFCPLGITVVTAGASKLTVTFE